jgi:hypothetical protein
MSIKNFDWDSIKKDDTILSLKGPFIWAKFNWYLGALRFPFMFIGTFVNPVLFIDLLITGPLLYGGYHRKKWSYYFFLISLIFNSLVIMVADPLSGFIATLIYTVPTFIYYLKRKKLFNIVDYPENDILEKYEVEKKVKGILTKTKNKSDKVIKDYELIDKYDKAKKATLEKSGKVIKDYELVDKYDKAKKATLEKSDKVIKKYELEDKYSKASGITKKAIGDIAKKININLGGDSTSDKLRELKSLFDEGLITEKEFIEKRKKLIKQL